MSMTYRLALVNSISGILIGGFFMDRIGNLRVDFLKIPMVHKVTKGFPP